MISKIELKETFNSFDISFITIDFNNKSLSLLKNNIVYKNEQIDIDLNKLTGLIKKYVTYWDNQYINKSIIDGKSSELCIYMSDEKVKYNFKNKFPYNYNEFIKHFKELVNII